MSPRCCLLRCFRRVFAYAPVARHAAPCVTRCLCCHTLDASAASAPAIPLLPRRLLPYIRRSLFATPLMMLAYRCRRYAAEAPPSTIAHAMMRSAMLMPRPRAYDHILRFARYAAMRAMFMRAQLLLCCSHAPRCTACHGALRCAMRNTYGAAR